MTAPTSNVNWLIEGIQLVVPSVIAAFLGSYFVARRQAREDQIESRLDDLTAQIEEVADDASLYWRKPALDPDVPILADKILAGLIRADGLRSIIEDRLSASSKVEITEAASAFFRDATGGDFGVHNRTQDIERSRTVIMSGAGYTVMLRRARMLDLSGWWRRR